MMHVHKHEKVQRAPVIRITSEGPAGLKIQNSNQEKSSKPSPIKRQEPQIGRNAPCPCGSGKKYKNCCGKNQ